MTISSIPVGLLFGFLIAKCGFNWLVEQGNLVSTGTGSMGVQNQQVPLFSLPVMLLCIFVSFLTVALALRKPMKIVSRISPIEATRYLENAETQKKGKRNGRKNVTVFSMAMANVTGNPKRTIGTILTMGLSCVLFVIISNYVEILTRSMKHVFPLIMDNLNCSLTILLSMMKDIRRIIWIRF